MKDTRETCYDRNSGKTQENTRPRFKPGDVVIYPWNGEMFCAMISYVFWDAELGGWIASLGTINAHEQNLIRLSEENEWIPHESLRWSWWTKKEDEE